MIDNCPQPQRECPFSPVQWGQMIEKLQNIHDDVLETKEKVKVQNGRIGKLENWRWYLMGAFGAVLIILKLLKVQI